MTHLEALRKLLAAYREAVKLRDPNHDDAISGEAHNAILHVEATQRAVERAVADMNKLSGHMTVDTISLLRLAASTVQAANAPTMDPPLLFAGHDRNAYLPGPRGMAIRLVSIDTGED
jgi:hypothetical protein